MILLVATVLFSPSSSACLSCFFIFIVFVFDFIIIEKAISDYQHLYYSAYYDGLTGIPSRLSADLFVKKNPSPENLSIVVADLDGLKTANDKYGHYTGDLLIKDFAKAFHQTAEPVGFAARNGGDEFLAVFPKDGDGTQAAAFCRRLEDSIRIHNQTARHPISYSIGYACGQDGTYASVQQLISCADQRMYRDKSRKKAENNMTEEQKTVE